MENVPKVTKKKNITTSLSKKNLNDNIQKQNKTTISLDNKRKLNTLSLITEITHSFYKCDNISSAANFICVQTIKVIPFERSFVMHKGQVLAVTGQPNISKSSEFLSFTKELFKKTSKSTEISSCDGILDKTEIIHIPLICPTSKIRWDWFVEIPKESPSFINALQLLKQGLSQGILHLYRKRSIAKTLRALISLPLIILLTFIAACFFYELPERVIAPVVVKAKDSRSARSRLSALVLTCVPEGKQVEKGSVLGSLDISEYQHEQKEALKGLTEISIKIDKATKESLSDSSKLIEIQLLKNEQSKLVQRIEYFEKLIAKSAIIAPISGTVRYLPEVSKNNDTNKGRHLNKGDVLCYVDDLSEKVAEISISESDINVLEDLSNIYIYTHNKPSIAQKTKVINIPDKPQVSELSGTYVYHVTATTNESLGISGTAHLQGKTVKLGWFLFKKIFLLFRGF